MSTESRDIRQTNALFDNLRFSKLTKSDLEFNHIREMLNRSTQMFEWKNIPESINTDYIEYRLQTDVVLFFTKYNGEYYLLSGTLSGLPDANGFPTEFIVANPYAKIYKTFKIGEDGVLIRNDTTLLGMVPIFQKYAKQLAENIITMNTVNILARSPYIISAPNGNVKKAAEGYIEKIEDGELSIVAESALTENIIRSTQFGSGASDLVPLIEYNQYLYARELQDIGLNANHNSKREALNSEEVGLNEDVLSTLPDDMYKCRVRACEQINEMYGLDVSVDFSSTWKKKEVVNETETESENEGGAVNGEDTTTSDAPMDE